MKDLTGKVALVTGASMGIGAGIAEALAARGCKVALLARGRDMLDQLAQKISAGGGVAVSYPCDVSDANALAAVVRQIEAQLGTVTILVNNAGAGTFKPLDAMSASEAILAVSLPFGAAVAACHAVVPGMISRREGHIVNLTSPAAYFPLPYMVPYTASRHAMLGLSLSLREELRQHGIGVSLLCPSKVETGYFERNDADFRWYPRLASVFPVLQPERVGNEAVKAIQRNIRELIFPGSLRIVVRLYQLAPGLSITLLRWLGLWQPARKI